MSCCTFPEEITKGKLDGQETHTQVIRVETVGLNTLSDVQNKLEKE